MRRTCAIVTLKMEEMLEASRMYAGSRSTEPAPVGSQQGNKDLIATGKEFYHFR